MTTKTKLPLAAEPKRIPKDLPCVPCEHNSVCCSYGVSLIPGEWEKIAARWGEDKLFVQDDGEPRTILVNGKCVFFVDGKGCSIHEEPEYPVTCKRFPWRDGPHPEIPYRWDLDICPELTNDMDRTLDGTEPGL